MILGRISPSAFHRPDAAAVSWLQIQARKPDRCPPRPGTLPVACRPTRGPGSVRRLRRDRHRRWPDPQRLRVLGSPVVLNARSLACAPPDRIGLRSLRGAPASDRARAPAAAGFCFRTSRARVPRSEWIRLTGRYRLSGFVAICGLFGPRIVPDTSHSLDVGVRLRVAVEKGRGRRWTC
jgi:hypothetical protein